ncbi:MAG: aminotransferase class V-fold PLP-dependent enzyme [Terracidiphilus sp.]|jgi:aspartate aminotransferase-like enzyme
MLQMRSRPAHGRQDRDGEDRVKEKLFTVGPVEMHPETLRIGGEQPPYFRTEEFSQMVLNCELMMCELAGAPAGSRMILLTCSGSGGMEAAVINATGPEDRVLIIVGGGFGERFCDICEANGIPYDALRLEAGRSLTPQQIDTLQLGRYRALLVNAHETSTGVLYDIERLGKACTMAGTYFIVDAISAFLCDPIDMTAMGIDTLLTSSQKGLALAPGLSILLLGPRSIERAARRKVNSYYFGLARYLADGARGQTPFTPAVTVILQLSERLRSIRQKGAAAMTLRCSQLAQYFRAAISELPLRMFPDSPSNALTALSPVNHLSAFAIYCELKNRFGFVVAPSGGELRDTLFRVGHMGNISQSDLDALACALKEITQ